MKHLQGWLMLLGVLIAALLAPVVFAGGPTGSGPDDPLYTTGAWMTIAPQTARWFYFDYAGDRSKIQVALDDYAATDEHPTQAQLAIFTPQQVLDWMQDPGTRPIGLGMPQKPGSAAAAHNLLWAGAFNFPGRFYAVVTNNTSTAITFRLTITGTGVTALPTPTSTPLPFYYANPFATPIGVATIPGKLVFQEASGGNIYTVNGDGSNLKRVTSGLDPAWSPDGTQIAFSRWKEPAAGLYIANADGSNEQGIVAAPQLLSPHSKQILFLSDRGGKWEFFVVGVDGSNLRQVLKKVSDTVGIYYNFSNERVMDWSR